jgi:2,3-dihydroxybenzoate-AMP ligase
MLKGAKVVLHQGVRDESVFPLIERLRVTHIHLMPALLIRWMNSPLLGRYDLSSLRVLQSGGQCLQPETRLLTERRLPNCIVQENFGMAEGTLMFVRFDDPRAVRLETVGRPVSDFDEVRLLDDDDREVTPGEVGEFCARGPYTLRGYFNAADYNASAFTADGFYRSGDLMRQHPSGNYVVEGRKKDVINRGGEKISAEEVENLILGHEAVKNVACVAMARSGARREDVRVRGAAAGRDAHVWRTLGASGHTAGREIQTARAPRAVRGVSVVERRQGLEEGSGPARA